MSKSVDELDVLYYYPIRAKYLGRDYAIDQALAHLAQYGSQRTPGFGNPYIPESDKIAFLDMIASWANAQDPNTWLGDLAWFERKARTKWYGPQGATPTDLEVESVINNYYTPIPTLELPYPSDVTIMEAFSDVPEIACDLLSAVALWKRYKGDRKSNSGLIGWGDRRDPLIRKRAVAEAGRYPLRLDPIVVGTRDQRSKKPCRAIFMDSLANYFREIRVFYPLADLWKNCRMVAWRGEIYVELYVHDFLKVNPSPLFFEADYEAMDTWCTEHHMLWLIDILENEGRITAALAADARILARELFKVPLWGPHGERTGKHSLFSGLYPTNPFETPLNLLIQLEWIHKVLEPKLGRSLRLDKDFIIIVNGDDAMIVFASDFGLDPEWMQQSFAEFAWNVYRIKARADKQRTSYTSGFFCKRQYKFAGFTRRTSLGAVYPKSIYPATLAALNTFEPEDGALASKSRSLIKLWQIWDGVYGHPLWRRCLRKLWEIQPELHIPVSPDEVDAWNAEGNHNWRRIIFGEVFSIEKSPSAQLWLDWSSKV